MIIWGLIAGMVLLAVLLPFGVKKLQPLLGRFTPHAKWAAGAFGVLCTVTAGWLAKGTIVGRRGVPAVIKLQPELLPRVAGLLCVVAVGFVVLALIPDWWSTIPADGRAATVGFLAPLLTPYLIGGWVGALSGGALDLVTWLADHLTSGAVS